LELNQVLRGSFRSRGARGWQLFLLSGEVIDADRSFFKGGIQNSLC